MQRPAAGENVVVQEVLDELCLLRPDNGDVLVLNKTASDVWLLASDGLAGSAVAERLAAAYSTPLAVVSRQVEDLLATFEQRGFLIDTA